MTQVGYGPLERIDGPLPVPPVYGLLPAARRRRRRRRVGRRPGRRERPVLDARRWRRHRPLGGGAPPQAGRGALAERRRGLPVPARPRRRVRPVLGRGRTTATKGLRAPLEHPQFGAMTVYLAETCTAYKVWTRTSSRRAPSRSRPSSRPRRPRVPDRRDRLPLNPHSRGRQRDVPERGHGDEPVMNALALLEDEIAKSGKLGLIHCSPQFATALRERFALDNKTGVIRTINGNVVIPDAGYANGSTPHGHARARPGRRSGSTRPGRSTSAAPRSSRRRTRRRARRSTAAGGATTGRRTRSRTAPSGTTSSTGTRSSRPPSSSTAARRAAVRPAINQPEHPARKEEERNMTTICARAIHLCRVRVTRLNAARVRSRARTTSTSRTSRSSSSSSRSSRPARTRRCRRLRLRHRVVPRLRQAQAVRPRARPGRDRAGAPGDAARARPRSSMPAIRSASGGRQRSSTAPASAAERRFEGGRTSGTTTTRTRRAYRTSTGSGRRRSGRSATHTLQNDF
jgi:hypothetical protein